MDTQHNTRSQHAPVALVTGGSRGLGRDMARNLAKKGIDVIITYRDQKESADKVVAEIQEQNRKAAALQLDVSKPQDYSRFIDQKLVPELERTFKTSKFDFLINNAGIGHFSPFAETSPEHIDSLINIHLKSAYLLTQLALPHLNDGGGIVNVSSGLTRIILPGYSAYATVKGALETLTKYQAKELGHRKIRVNIVAPGAIETDFNGGAVRDNQEMNERIASFTALGRVGLPTDIGPVVAFLCTQEGYWVNGQRIEVSGGQHL